MAIDSSQGTDYIVSAENIKVDTTNHLQTVLIVNDTTNFCFRLAKAVYVSFFKAENEISSIINYAE